MSSEQNPEECDARDDDSSNAVGYPSLSLVDIGLFITLIGLVNGGFIIRNDVTIIDHAPLTNCKTAHLCNGNIANCHFAPKKNKRRYSYRDQCNNTSFGRHWPKGEGQAAWLSGKLLIFF